MELIDNYVLFVKTLNKYSGGIPINVSENWEASIKPLKTCFNDLERLDDVSLFTDNPESVFKGLQFEEQHGDYLHNVSFILREKESIISGFEIIRKEADGFANSLFQGDKWTWEDLCEWRSLYGNCLELWERYATKLSAALNFTHSRTFDTKLSELFKSQEDLENFFACQESNTMTAADWARRAFKYSAKGLLYFDLKGFEKRLYEEIKRKHPNVASYSTFQKTFRILSTR